MSLPESTWESHAVVCPWCKYENDPSDYRDEGEEEMACGRCEKKLKLTVHFFTKYEVEAIEE